MRSASFEVHPAKGHWLEGQRRIYGTALSRASPGTASGRQRSEVVARSKGRSARNCKRTLGTDPPEVSASAEHSTSNPGSPSRARMTTLKQFEANRLNALKSTGPRTEGGKRRSRCNAIRHGLTAETVIVGLEDPEDYEAFEAKVIADYDARSAVERELVLRLASILWRLRRATGIETSLFQSAMKQSGQSEIFSRATADML